MDEEKYKSKTCAMCGKEITEEMSGVVFHSKEVDFACCGDCVQRVEEEVMNDASI